MGTRNSHLEEGAQGFSFASWNTRAGGDGGLTPPAAPEGFGALLLPQHCRASPWSSFPTPTFLIPALSGSAGASQAAIINEASFINYLRPGREAALTGPEREVPHPGNALLEAPGETLGSGGFPLGCSTWRCPFPPQHKGSVGSTSRSWGVGLGGMSLE